jgi:hypothetical protein
LVIVLAVSLAVALLAAGCGGSKKADSSGDATTATTATTNDESTPAKVATIPKSFTAKTATPKANPPKSNSDTDVFREVAIKSCLDEATSQDVSAAMAQEYCTCAIDELLKNVSADELRQIGEAGLSADQTLPPAVDQKLMDAVMACVDKLIGQ